MNAGRRISLLQAGSIAWFFAHFSLAVAFFGLLVVASDAKADVYSVHSSWNSLGVNSVYYFSLADAENSLRTTSRCDTRSDFTFHRLGSINKFAYPQVVEGRTVVSSQSRYYRPQFTFLTVPKSAGCPVETDAHTGQSCWVVATNISDPDINPDTIRCYSWASYRYLRGALPSDAISVLAEGDSLCSIRLSGPGGTNGALADVEPGKVVSGMRAEVTCDGVPSDKAVTLTVEANANTGGHNHHDSARRPGTLNPASGTSPLTFSFTAPAPAGDHTITAKCMDGSCGEDTGKVWVGVKDLAPLSGLSGDYRLVGGDSVHPGNSHLSSQASPVISNIAGLYKIVTQFDAPPTPVLHLNDASLERGGLFDIQYPGRGTTWWTAPHSTHRFGVEIDVRANPKVNPGTAIPETNFADFEYVATEFNATRCPPGPGPGYMRTDNQHYHVCLRGGDCCQGGNR